MTVIEKWEAHQREIEDRRLLARLARVLDRMAITGLKGDTEHDRPYLPGPQRRHVGHLVPGQ